MILDRLRAETRPAHERLEQHIDLLGRSWSPAFYHSLLRKFYGFYAIVEPRIWNRPEWCQLHSRIEERRKLGLLHRDMVDMGHSTEEIALLPLCSRAPAPSSFAGVLGCAYVLEGATLGGQIITRHLRHEMRLEEGRGCAFFASYGEATGPMWREFTEFLNSQPLSRAEADSLIENARNTFDSLDEWLADIL
jgi:heme oxygenase